MTKDIKVKTFINAIKIKDNESNLTHYLKQSTISTIDKKPKSTQSNTENKDNNQINQAVQKVETTGKVTSIDSARRMKNYAKTIAKNKKERKKNEIKVKEKITDNIKQKTNSKTAKVPKENKLIKEKKSVQMTHKITMNNYSQKMKSFALTKHKVKTKNKLKTNHIKGGIKSIFHGIQKIFKVVVTSIRTVSNLLSYGMAFVLLVVISLFFGVFSALSDDTVQSSVTLPLSQEVIDYSEIISKYAQQYSLEEYVPLIQAVMMQESSGQGNDPMQSSECEYNTKYPKKKNGITNPEYSIDVGIHYLSDCLIKADVKEKYDIKKISLGLHGYNYGKGYIDWALEHFGGYTKANAKVYSDEKKAELKVEIYGDPNYAPNVLRYYHIGGNGKIVDVARSQLGNIGGKVYWSWWGYTSRVEWCAIFVSWCADQSNLIQEGVIPKFENCVVGTKWFKEKGKWLPKGSLPNSGDIIFFDWEQDGITDHVGIVEKVENDIIYTIEGNSNNQCKQNTYNQNNMAIFGYGISN